jgi:hypothetical protein
MHGARVRAFYESDEVLRRLAGTLRQIGADEPSQPTLDENGATSLPATPKSITRPDAGRHAALLGALRRSRETLEVLDRVLTARAHSESATTAGGDEP